MRLHSAPAAFPFDRLPAAVLPTPGSGNGRSMPRIVIGDGALYYERQGVGFPVMFVSGLAGFASFWHDQAVAFAKNFDVITHDHRGIGQSDLTRSGFTVDRMAADVIGLMDGLEAESSEEHTS